VPVGLAMYAARRVVQGAVNGGQGGTGGAGSLVTGPGMDKLLGPVKRWLQDFF